MFVQILIELTRYRIFNFDTISIRCWRNIAISIRYRYFGRMGGGHRGSGTPFGGKYPFLKCKLWNTFNARCWKWPSVSVSSLTKLHCQKSIAIYRKNDIFSISIRYDISISVYRYHNDLSIFRYIDSALNFNIAVTALFTCSKQVTPR